MGLLDGVLPAIYSASNTANRRLKGLLADPAGTLGLGVTRFAEDNNNLLNTMANAYPMAGDRTVLNSPKQNALARALLADKGTEMGMGAATVWHGSPHKFDKFDSSKIGTGEGAQAYGHGLYLAESPDVAKGYRDTLSNSQLHTPDSQVFDVQSVLKNPNVRSVLQRTNGDIDAAIARANGVIDSIPGTMGADYAAHDLQQLQKAKQAGGLSRPEGSLYKVDLPDEHIAKMLDWDKPLSQQHPDVQAAFSLDKFPNNSAANMTGMEAYVKTGQMLGEPTSSSVAAAQALLKKGIPGIRYLDGGSRGAGAGSSNYVVFPGNENLLQILERNGKGLLAK